MAQRIEPTDSLDDFPTPPWGTRAGIAVMRERGLPIVSSMTVSEPACNRGYMVRPLEETFKRVYATDIHDYGFGYGVHDFTMSTFNNNAQPDEADWYFTNPPFIEAARFVQVALRRARVGVAMFVRMQWLEGQDRYEQIFGFPGRKPAMILQFTERVLLMKGRIVKPGTRNPETGKPYSTATAYCWVVWLKDHAGGDPPFVWIPPCRARFERPEDYRLEVKPS